jgi:drug/metabolite transporter (DMT)-like permease
LSELAPPPSHPMSSTRPSAALVWTALAIVYIVWGSTYLAIRITVETLPPFLSAGLRFGLSGLLLGAIIAIRSGPAALRVSGRQVAASGLVGLLLLGGGNGMVVVAEARGVPSGIAALLVATVPLLVVVLRVVTGDRPRAATLIGVLLGFAGLAALIASRGGGGVVPVRGALLVVAAATSWSIGSFFSRQLPLPANPFVAAVYEMIVGGLAMALGGALRGEPAQLAHGSTRSWFALLYLLMVGSLVAFTAYVWLLQRAPISLTATYAYVNPAVAVLLGALLLDERITGPVLLSGAVIILGVALVVSTERPARAAPVPEPPAEPPCR